MPRKTKLGRITLDTELCKACYLCISICPKNLITVSDKLNTKGYYPAEFTDANNKKKDRKCIGCAQCAIVCPDIAIEVFRE